jgi:hypothetical protein
MLRLIGYTPIKEVNMETDKIILKKDLIIPKGTVFENIDGETSHYCYDNYAVVISLDNDTTARIIVSSENEKYFKEG